MMSSRPQSCRHLALVVAISLWMACDDGADSVTEPEPQPVTPLTLACAAPATLDGIPNWNDPRFVGFIVTYHAGVDPSIETARLAARYRFTPRFIYRHALLGFSAMLTPETLSAILCEASVRRVAVVYLFNVLAAQ